MPEEKMWHVKKMQCIFRHAFPKGEEGITHFLGRLGTGSKSLPSRERG